MGRVRRTATAAPGPVSAGRSPTWPSRCSRRPRARAPRSRSTTRTAQPSALPPLGGSSGRSANPAAAAATAARTPFPLPTAAAAPASRLGSQGGTNSGTGSLNASALAAKVDPGIVDITSDLKYSDATAEGTGMVISSSGLVLTNNHVIDEATSVSATLVTSGRTYTAKVIGYDSTDDVALLQLVGASGLKTVTLSDSSKAKVGEAVLALGNAGGRGGLPSTAQGTIQALNQSIKASDSGAGTTEQLHGMIETNAPIQEGDSGGPLVNGSGAVVGMDTAANATAGFGALTPPPRPGFAIPINTALSIANQISSGKASATVHIGLAGFMGVNVADASTRAHCRRRRRLRRLRRRSAPPVSSGALICEVYPGAPGGEGGPGRRRRDHLGQRHDRQLGGRPDQPDGGRSHPGDQFAINYVRPVRHTTTVTYQWADASPSPRWRRRTPDGKPYACPEWLTLR